MLIFSLVSIYLPLSASIPVPDVFFSRVFLNVRKIGLITSVKLVSHPRLTELFVPRERLESQIE